MKRIHIALLALRMRLVAVLLVCALFLLTQMRSVLPVVFATPTPTPAPWPVIDVPRVLSCFGDFRHMARTATPTVAFLHAGIDIPTGQTPVPTGIPVPVNSCATGELLSTDPARFQGFLENLQVTVIDGPPEQWYILLPITPTPSLGTPTPSPQYYMMDIIRVLNVTQSIDYVLGTHHYDTTTGLSQGRIDLTPLPAGTPRPSPSDDIRMQVSYYPLPDPLKGEYGYTIYARDAQSTSSYGYAHVTGMHKYCPRAHAPDTGYLFYTNYPATPPPGKPAAMLNRSTTFADIARFPAYLYGSLPDHLELQVLSRYDQQQINHEYANPLQCFGDPDPESAVPFLLTDPSVWPTRTPTPAHLDDEVIITTGQLYNPTVVGILRSYTTTPTPYPSSTPAVPAVRGELRMFAFAGDRMNGTCSDNQTPRVTGVNNIGYWIEGPDGEPRSSDDVGWSDDMQWVFREAGLRGMTANEARSTFPQVYCGFFRTFGEAIGHVRRSPQCVTFFDRLHHASLHFRRVYP